MYKTISEVFQGECGRLNVDANLVKRLRLYEANFVTKNSDHIEFFGGKLLGVNPVKFLPGDRMRWFEEVLVTDETVLEPELLALPTVNEDWIVSSDTMNLSCAWLAHALFISPKLTPEQKHQGMIDVMLILQYKFLTSRLYQHFRYPADRAVAEATYASLSDKYLIKQYDSWKALFRARAEAIIAKDSPHYQTIVKMNDDEGVIYLLNDVQGRIRDMLKNIYDVFLKVHNSGLRINTSSSVTDHDGEKILKDKTKNLTAYTRYLHEIVTDKHSFIRAELVTVIEKLVHTAPPKVFQETLDWISDNYRKSGGGLIEKLLNETLVHSFAYLDEHRQYVRGNPNLPDLLSRLKGVYMSSRSTDPVLMDLREMAEKIVTMATKNKNTSVVASVRTALLLYLVARTLTMSHYAG
jgi:hypothetical protein